MKTIFPTPLAHCQYIIGILRNRFGDKPYYYWMLEDLIALGNAGYDLRYFQRAAAYRPCTAADLSSEWGELARTEAESIMVKRKSERIGRVVERLKKMKILEDDPFL